MTDGMMAVRSDAVPRTAVRYRQDSCYQRDACLIAERFQWTNVREPLLKWARRHEGSVDM